MILGDDAANRIDFFCRTTGAGDCTLQRVWKLHDEQKASLSAYQDNGQTCHHQMIHLAIFTGACFADCLNCSVFLGSLNPGQGIALPTPDTVHSMIRGGPRPKPWQPTCARG